MSFTLHPPSNAELREEARARFLSHLSYERRLRQLDRLQRYQAYMAQHPHISELSLNSTIDAFPQGAVGLVMIVSPWDFGHGAVHDNGSDEKGAGEEWQEGEQIPSLYESVLESTADSIRLTKYRCPEWMKWGGQGRGIRKWVGRWVNGKLEGLRGCFKREKEGVVVVDEKERSRGRSSTRGSGSLRQ